MSVNFDRATETYDATRAMPDSMAEAVFEQIIQLGAIEPGLSLLELGVGTGRIAIPIIEKIPLQYTGIDISRKMMARLEEKAPGEIRLARGDVTMPPFRKNSFDVILAVHLFHLVPQWRTALVLCYTTNDK